MEGGEKAFYDTSGGQFTAVGGARKKEKRNSSESNFQKWLSRDPKKLHNFPKSRKKNVKVSIFESRSLTQKHISFAGGRLLGYW